MVAEITCLNCGKEMEPCVFLCPDCESQWMLEAAQK